MANAGEPVGIKVSGIPKFKAIFGERKGRKAVRILDEIDNIDAADPGADDCFKPASAAS